jgi:hypothetical protein
MDSSYADDRLRRKCLLALRKICGRCGELPSSHVITEGLERKGDCAIASGGFSDVWEGIYGVKRVAIKAFRIYYTDDLVRVKKVRRCTFPCLPNGPDPFAAEILQRSCNMEVADSP